MPQRLAARVLLRVRDEHRPERAHLLDQAREVGEVDPRPGRDHVARRIAPRHLELLVVDRRPDLDHVAAERAARLGADRDDDRLGRRSLLEARRDREHPIERLARAPLELVEPGALERLPTEVGGDPGQRPHLRRDRIGFRNGNPIAPASRSPTKTGTASAPDAYGASAAPSGKRETNSCRRCAQAGLPSRAAVVIGARAVSGKRAPGAQRLPARAARVDDHELVALDEPEGAARAPIAVGTPSTITLATSSTVSAAESDAASACRRSTRSRDRSSRSAATGCALLAAAHRDPDAADHEPDDERCRPAHEVVARAIAERHPRRRERPGGEAPAGDDRGDAARPACEPRPRRHRTEERRVDDLVAEAEEEQPTPSTPEGAERRPRARSPRRRRATMRAEVAGRRSVVVPAQPPCLTACTRRRV